MKWGPEQPENGSENVALLDEKTLKECENLASKVLKESAMAASDALKPAMKLERGEKPEEILDELFLWTELGNSLYDGSRLSPTLLKKGIEMVQGAGNLGPGKAAQAEHDAYRNLLIKYVSTRAAENPQVLDDKEKRADLDGETESKFVSGYRLGDLWDHLAKSRVYPITQRFADGDEQISPDTRKKIDSYLELRRALYDIEMVARYGGYLARPSSVAAVVEKIYRKTVTPERTMADLYEGTEVPSFPLEVYETAAKMQAMFTQLSRPYNSGDIEYKRPPLF